MKAIVPRPSSLVEREGFFELRPDSTIGFGDAAAGDVAVLLAEYLRPATGFALPVAAGAGSIVLSVVDPETPDENGFNSEAYSLDVAPDGVALSSRSAAGLARGVQTLRQLFPAEIHSRSVVAGAKWTAPCVAVEDAPVYRWRGMHLDVARHFFDADDVCRYIELLAQHRMNVFHWHLTDDQGWRIEIKKYPRLTEVGSVRKRTLIGHHNKWPHRFDDVPHGGFYTQDDIRRVVSFAARRHVTVVPEIDMPGHMVAAITAYPRLGNGFVARPEVRTVWGISKETLNLNDETIGFCRDVWRELFDLFPGKFFHIGGDEAPRGEWEESDAAQELMIKRGLASPAQLQSHFTNEMAEFFAAHGRRLIGWDEILEGGGIRNDAAVMVWRSGNFNEKAAEAASSGHDMVLSVQSYTYFDYYQAEPVDAEPLAIGGLLTLPRVYEYDPAALAGFSDERRMRILGAQAQLWTEYIPTRDHLDYMAYPRACALAEALWTKPENKSFEDFSSRLTVHLQRLSLQGVKFRRA